jgi:hypothetical protein
MQIMYVHQSSTAFILLIVPEFLLMQQACLLKATHKTA